MRGLLRAREEGHWEWSLACQAKSKIKKTQHTCPLYKRGPRGATSELESSLAAGRRVLVRPLAPKSPSPGGVGQGSKQ